MAFKVRARVNLIDEEILVAMKDAGVKSVVYGIESGSQIMLDLMNKHATVEMNYNAIKLTKKVGLQRYTDIFIGYPGETPETIRDTERLILKTKPTAINMSIMYPLPNTRVYNEAKEKGTLRSDWDVYGSQAWIELPWIENRETPWKYRNQILKRFISHPIVIFNVIRFWLLKIDMKQFKILFRYYFRFGFKG